MSTFLPDQAGPPPAAPSPAALEHALFTALGVLNGVFLLALGLVAGIVTGLSVSWLAWLWLTGGIGQVLAATTALLVLAALFAACRATGWATGSRWGAGALALGWVLASFAMIGLSFGGDILMTSSPVNYLFLYGGVLAAVLGTVRTPAEPVRTRAGTAPGPS